MPFEAQYRSAGDSIDWTPETAIVAGEVVAIGSNNLGVAHADIAAGVKGSLRMTGIFDVAKQTGAIAVGDDVHWQSGATPVGGTATGAANDTGAGVYFGLCIQAAGSSDTTVRVLKWLNGEGVS